MCYLIMTKMIHARDNISVLYGILLTKLLRHLGVNLQGQEASEFHEKQVTGKIFVDRLGVKREKKRRTKR